MSVPQFVYFDLDDTLLDHRAAERLALGDLQDQFSDIFGGIELGRFQDAYHSVNSDVWHRYGAGTISKEEAKLERFERLLTELAVTPSESPSELGAFYMHRYSKYWSYVPGARDAFLQIADFAGVGILTNGFKEVQRAKLGQFTEIQRSASAVVISEEVGFMKPDRRIFDHATTLAGVPPQDILYIGDSYRSDVRGGLDAGWNVIWFTPDLADETSAFSDLPSDYDPAATQRVSDWGAVLECLPTSFRSG